ncbi:glycoside hydrolase superfamily [Cristinia sonorae]|uniref:Alpha-amylase n=1 Tax=Cristinia sonorae TaxID=1940300 RepID=A0A8K0XPJ4_9AGAR|nr:glycoside hydrolase superfamily [Cristinia sonorae]
MKFLALASVLLPLLVSQANAAPSGHASNITRHKLVARTTPGSKPVIIQMFQWSYASVAQECKEFIGPAGYGFVQVSPPTEHITGSQWWTDYQPVSYTLTSKHGNRDDLKNMVDACHSAGVKVLVDTVWNHMAGIDSGSGVAGTQFSHYNYPGTYSSDNFHYCGTPGNDIQDWNNRQQVQTCELANLADLATETEYVRNRLAQYGNDLMSLGVDGFRLDAAKHMTVDDIQNIIGRLNPKPQYITQEVVSGDGETIQGSEYTGIGDVHEFRYTVQLKEAFSGNGISGLQSFNDPQWTDSSHANVFVANHDSERGNAAPSLNVNSPSNTYITANIFALAHPYGTPTVLSSYSFGSNDDGAPNGGAGSCSGSGGANGWLCQHRWTPIAGMVQFRNTVGSSGLNNWVSPQSQQIAFGRGSAGFVAINNADSEWSATFQTSLPDGTYCDVVSGGTSCSGTKFTVSGGSFTATVPARNAIAIHVGSKA